VPDESEVESTTVLAADEFIQRDDEQDTTIAPPSDVIETESVPVSVTKTSEPDDELSVDEVEATTEIIANTKNEESEEATTEESIVEQSVSVTITKLNEPEIEVQTEISIDSGESVGSVKQETQTSSADEAPTNENQPEVKDKESTATDTVEDNEVCFLQIDKISYADIYFQKQNLII